MSEETCLQCYHPRFHHTNEGCGIFGCTCPVEVNDTRKDLNKVN